MKTNYSSEDVQHFLQTTEHAIPDSIEQLAEGNISQALAFETTYGDRRVLRLSSKKDDFLADQYAYEHFGNNLLVPRLVEIGTFRNDAYYCISERVEGVISDELDEQEMLSALPAIHDVFARIFTTDISSTSGYGHPDFQTGNAKYATWKEALVGRLDDMNPDKLKQNANNIKLDSSLVDEFIAQYNSNLSYASEVRRLTHGDLGFNNLLVKGTEVTAVIDWSGVGYGDWMYDFAKLDFWWPGRFGDVQKFAAMYNLDSNNLKERKALYWARSALSTTQWADEFKNDKVASWLREYVKDRLV